MFTLIFTDLLWWIQRIYITLCFNFPRKTGKSFSHVLNKFKCCFVISACSVNCIYYLISSKSHFQKHIFIFHILARHTKVCPISTFHYTSAHDTQLWYTSCSKLDVGNTNSIICVIHFYSILRHRLCNTCGSRRDIVYLTWQSKPHHILHVLRNLHLNMWSVVLFSMEIYLNIKDSWLLGHLILYFFDTRFTGHAFNMKFCYFLHFVFFFYIKKDKN